jgi:beta-glucosidase-like glycosyl hydrolase
MLTSRMGVAFVTGMQGDDPRYLKTIAAPKHYAVHSGPESMGHSFNAKVSEYDLVHTYLYAFKATVTEGKAGSIMCVYNAVDGVPGCASTDLLQRRLREQWGFTGYVVSDCGAIGDIFRNHKFVATQVPRPWRLSRRERIDLRRRVRPARRAQGRHHHDRDHAFRRAVVRGAHQAGMFDPRSACRTGIPSP